MTRGPVRITRLAFVIFNILVLANLISSVRDLRARQGILKEREERLLTLEADNQALEAAILEASTSAFIEREARNSLGLVKPGEVVVMLEEGMIASIAGIVEEPQEEQPSMRMWWNVFF